LWLLGKLLFHRVTIFHMVFSLLCYILNSFYWIYEKTTTYLLFFWVFKQVWSYLFWSHLCLLFTIIYIFSCVFLYYLFGNVNQRIPKPPKEGIIKSSKKIYKDDCKDVSIQFPFLFKQQNKKLRTYTLLFVVWLREIRKVLFILEDVKCPWCFFLFIYYVKLMSWGKAK
jgi:hypothetical protein